MRVLVVDDDIQARSVMRFSLGHMSHGLATDEADDGRDAVFKFIQSCKAGMPYDVVLLDYEMPVMNGKEALNMIRLYEKDHPAPGHVTTVLVTSGHPRIEEIFGDVLIHDPQVKVLGKPVDLRELQKFIAPNGSAGTCSRV